LDCSFAARESFAEQDYISDTLFQ
ncbi:unnamed protein product, partial [Cuscuta campestris]